MCSNELISNSKYLLKFIALLYRINSPWTVLRWKSKLCDTIILTPFKSAINLSKTSSISAPFLRAISCDIPWNLTIYSGIVKHLGLMINFCFFAFAKGAFRDVIIHEKETRRANPNKFFL